MANHPVPQNRKEMEEQTRYAHECAEAAAARKQQENLDWQERDRVRLTAEGCRCPVHGNIPGAEYTSQRPAPCGCEWIWDERTSRLTAHPAR